MKYIDEDMINKKFVVLDSQQAKQYTKKQYHEKVKLNNIFANVIYLYCPSVGVVAP